MKVEQTTCPDCNGILREASLYDDWEGKLTCVACSRRTDRWLEVIEKDEEMLSNFTNQQLIDILKDLDPEVEKEHRRGSSFYATAYVEVSEGDQKYIECDISSLFGKRIVGIGTWDDDWGLDLYDAWVESKTIQHIPEEVKVIPAQDIEVWTKENK